MEELDYKNEAPEKSASSKKLKKNLYRWHRVMGLITVIPLIIWTASGLMHPMMAHWFKVQLAHDRIEQIAIDKSKVSLSLQQVSSQNNINSFYNFRLINFKDSVYYQVKEMDKSVHYFNAYSGKELVNGDQLYAQFLARYFLGDEKSKIDSSVIINAFTSKYQYVNRLLPVYKVSFATDSKMDLYVETFGSRLATYNDADRKAFLWIFSNFHTWAFMDNITNDVLHYGLMILLLGIIIFASISGMVIYGFLWKRFKNPKKENSLNLLRKYHRQIGIITSVFMLTFAFSGAYHASTKINPEDKVGLAFLPILKPQNFKVNNLSLNIDWERLNNMSAVVLKKDTLYQLMYAKTDDSPAEIKYISALSGDSLANGDIKYASYLANKFQQSGDDVNMQLPECCKRPVDENQNVSAKITSAEAINSFTREYGFVFKRLPVVKVAFDSPDHQRYFIETAQSKLASEITDADMREGYSFAFLHKFFFMEWAGQGVRDFTMALAAFSVMVVSLLGLAIFIKKM
nr:PepSY domain-containing protein [uncultured Pedobacter sp.]